MFQPDPKKEPKPKKPIKPLKRVVLKRAKHYKLKKVSDKESARLKEYRKLRKEYLEINFMCEYNNCISAATDIHHKDKRGKNLNNVSTWIALCRMHHIEIHDKNIKL